MYSPALDSDKGACDTVAAVIFNVDTMQGGNGNDRNEELVLVDVVKLCQFPNLKLSSRVRLYFIKEEAGKARKLPPYRFVNGRGFYIRSTLPDREADPVRIEAGELYDDVIKRRPKIVHNIANDGWKHGWIRGGRIHLDKIAAGITIFLDGQFAEVRLKEGYDRFCILANVAVGPFDL